MFPAAQRIRELADDHGLSLRVLFLRSGLNYNLLRTAEKSGYQISLTAIELICKTLDIPLAEFFTLDAHTRT